MTDIYCWSCGTGNVIDDGPPYRCARCDGSLKRRIPWHAALDIEAKVRSRDRLPPLGHDDISALAQFLEVDQAAILDHLRLPPAQSDGNRLAPDGQDASPAPILAPRSVCSGCGAVYTDTVAFCSTCGSPTQPPDDDTRLRALESQLATVQYELHALQVKTPEQEFRWQQVRAAEKWAVTWGVWGRTILVNIMLFVGFIIILAAAGLMAS